MSKDNIKKKKNYKEDNKYNAENEIIIGVTTKPKEKVRADKKTARTKQKNNKNKTNNVNIKSTKNKTNKNKVQNKSIGQAKNKIQNQKLSKPITKEKAIKKINRRKTIISVVILFFIVIIGGIYFLTTPVFNVASIEVTGNNKNSIDTYISLSEININETNIFAFSGSDIEKRLKNNPYVEAVKVKKVLPNILELHVTERTLAYQVKYLNSYIYLNDQGYILEINEEKQNVPTIEGISSIQENIQPGQRLKNEDLLKLDTILKIVNYLKYNNISESKLTLIKAEDITNYILEFKEDNKTVYIGDSSSITEKMTAVTQILEAEKGKKGKIYANEDALKRNRIYFREEK